MVKYCKEFTIFARIRCIKFTMGEIKKGTILKVIRTSCGLSQGELATKADLSITTITNYESLKRGLSQERLFSLIDIMGGEVSMSCRVKVGDFEFKLPMNDNIKMEK